MNPDPLAPARGCLWGLILGVFCWAVASAVLVVLGLP